MDTLSTINGLLIVNNFGLSTCCCGDSVYWEMVPCSEAMIPGESCFRPDGCDLINRKYLATTTSCSGPVNKVCECQRLGIEGWGQCATGVITDFLSITYNGGASGTVEFTSTGVILNDNGSIDTFSTYQTLDSLIGEINGLPSWFSQLENPPGVAGFYSATIVATGTQDAPVGGTTLLFDTCFPGISFLWNGETTAFVPFTSNATGFASGISSGLIPTIGTGIVTTFNEPLSESLYFDGRIFEISFGGDLCGIAQPFISGANVALFGTGTTITPTFSYGVYEPLESYLDSNIDCYQIGTDTICPYEDNANGGPSFYVSGIACCPQRGCQIGPNQTLNLEQFTGVSGYCVAGCTTYNPYSIDAWANLENTIGDEDGCFQVSPYYFLFGKEGRFTYDYYTNRRLFVQPSCPFGQSNECDDSQLPNNSVVELFLPRFSIDAPWGPFGSYYHGIAETTHQAWKFPYNDASFPSGQSYLSQFFADRYGVDYRPEGWIKTRGEWTATKEIEVYACIHRPTGFYVGTGVGDDLDLYVDIDPSTVDPSFILNDLGVPGESCFTLLFATAGKTIMDFVSGINAIRSMEGCRLFDFCVGSESAGQLPADRVINTSAEVFQNFVNSNGDLPDADTAKLSGADLTVGLSYWQNFEDSPDGVGIRCGLGVPGVALYPVLPSYETGDVDLCPPTMATLPPMCRTFTDIVPTYSSDRGGAEFDFRKNKSTWWHSLQGKNTPVITLGKNDSEPYNINLTDLTVNVTDRKINIYCSGVDSGIPFARSGYIDTNNGGLTLGVNDAVLDINAFSLNKVLGGVFFPVSGFEVQDFAVWLDDDTFTDGVFGSYGDYAYPLTTYNYSYKEPLVNSDQASLMLESVDLQSWVRTRCDTRQDWFPPAVPPSAGTSADDPDCSADATIVEGWVRSFGCSSTVCLQQYYYRTSRCPCDTVYRCVDDFDGTQVPHPYNHEGDSFANLQYSAYYDDMIAITQPLVYICEYAIHPNFDIPCLVKVPFQIFTAGGGVLKFQNGVFGDGLSANDSSSPYYSDFCDESGPGPKLYSNAVGWCQYFDPASPKVTQDDIPYSTPSTAIVVNPTNGPFYSVHPWNFNPHLMLEDIGDLTYGTPELTMHMPESAGVGCSCLSGPCDACPSCYNWDRISNAKPVFTNGQDNRWSLTILFRPILKNVTSNDIIAGTDNCNRIDIDCSTACCECNFTCADDCDTTLSKHPYTQVTDYSEQVHTEVMSGCDADGSACGCTSISIGVCSCSTDICYFSPCYNDGKFINEWSANFSVVRKSCGCRINGTDTSYCVTESRSIEDCDCSGSTNCLSFTCSAVTEPQEHCWTCDTPLTGGCSGDCTDERAAFRDNVNCSELCSPLVTINYDQITNFCCNIDTAACGYYHSVYSSSIAAIYEGTSPLDSSDLGYFGGSCQEEVNNTYTDTMNVEYTSNPAVWTTCSYTADVTPKVYSYIVSWVEDHADFVCGYGNVRVSYDLGA